MQIVIDIPGEAYERLLQTQSLPEGFDVTHRVLHGTPLPKGHDDLIDRRNAIKSVCTWGTECERKRIYELTMVEIKNLVANIMSEEPTIIEADKETDG